MLDQHFSKELVEIWKREAPQLNPHQEAAIKNGLLDNQNVVVAAPTASGKTLIAEFGIMSSVSKGKKAVYIVPLRALASEKYDEFKTKYEPLGVRVALSIGDMDSNDNWLEKFDIIIATSEKMDSLLRHGAPWIDRLGIIVVDEIHLLNDSSRGPTLEVTLTRLREVSKAQILALSATIKNAEEIATWLGAKCILSDYRPVKLREGVYDGTEMHFPPHSFEMEGSEDKPEDSVIDDTMKKEKQALVFLSSRRNAEASAENLTKTVSRRLKPEEKLKLSELSDKILGVLESPTKQCRRLAECVRGGTAFHHAGLVSKQRKLVEENFRNNLIKVISATPTLAAGVNLPAYRVVIRDIKRYYGTVGYEYIPVLDYKQMAGRAGRPKYDKEGESIIISRGQRETEELIDRYIHGKPEEIYSKLALEPVLRMHILALVASGFTKTERELMQFFAKTFYAHQFGNTQELEDKIDRTLSRLTEQRFILRSGASLSPTRVGKRVAELYLDPESATKLIEALESGEKKGVTHFGLLSAATDCLEMRPGLTVGRDAGEIAEQILKREEELLIKPPDEWDIEYDDFLRTFKSALMLETWTSEQTEEQILEKYKTAPGELRAKVDIADWLLYSSQELALLLNMKEMIKEVRRARTRIKYGIKEELLPLIRLEGIGRMRARRLYNSGFTSIAKLREAPLERLELLIGPKTAASVKKQLSGLERDKEEKDVYVQKTFDPLSDA